MTYQNYRWFAFSEQDLLKGADGDCSISVGDVINVPTQANYELSVKDNDHRLSGDKRDQSVDDSQKAFVNGHAITGQDMYAERVFTLCGSDGQYYQLLEIEIEHYSAPGKGDDFFTFVGDVPPAGVQLEIVSVDNVDGCGVAYSDLMSVPTQNPKNVDPVFDNLPDDNILMVAENETAVIDVDATDPDGDDITYSIVPGKDGDAFKIDPKTGELSFVAPPNFEQPTDVTGGDNTYDVTIRADDGQGGVVDKTLWVKVQDVDEGDAPVCIVIEAETMDLSGFDVRQGHNASSAGIVRLSDLGSSGEISTTFNGAAGAYDLSLFVQDESDGQSDLQIKVNGTVVGQATLDADTDDRGNDNGQFSEVAFPQIMLHPGDTVAIVATGDKGEFVRIDKIELCQDGGVCPEGFALLDFEGFDAGIVVSDQFDGVTITAQRDRNNTDDNDAMLFDSANPTGGDTDLAYEDQGNLLIVSEDNDSDDPDDAVGGTITFDFDAPSDLHDIKILDVEEPGGTITLTFANGETRIIDIPVGGNNSEQTIALDAAGVTQMQINLVGSGAVDDLCWAPGTPAPDVGSLSGRVFMDADDNGVDDAEMGVAGVTVTLVGADGTDLATTQTGPDGSYQFDGLAPGDYTVRFPTDVDGKVLVGQDLGDDDSIDSDANTGTGLTAPVTVVAGATTPDVDAGIADPGTVAITGTLFMDTDKSGTQSEGDMPVAGAVVTLLKDGVTFGMTETGQDGSYSFDDLEAGDDYVVQFGNPTDKVFTDQDAGDDDAIDSDANATGQTAPITVVAGETTPDVDAGLVDPGTASLGGRVFVDSNDDSIDNNNGDEAALAGVPVTLLDREGNVVATTETGADGSYLFEDLDAGDYVVSFPDTFNDLVLVDQDAGDDDTADSDAGLNGNTAPISVSIGADIRDIDAGLEAPAALVGSLSGRVFMDADDNGVDDAEMGVAGVTVTLVGADGTDLATTQTGPDGSYQFDGLAPGDYTVRFPTDVDGKVLVGQDVGDDDSIDSDADTGTGLTAPVTVVAGATTPDVDAGIADPGTASLAGRIFTDADGNDVDDAEMGVGGVTVTLQDADGDVVATTQTGADGSYIFGNLDAGDYVVVFPTQTADGKVLVGQDAGDDDTVDSDAGPDGTAAPISIGIGEDITDVDAGVTDPGTASLGGRFFVDADKDDLEGDGDTSVSGATVQLLLGGIVVATTTTDAEGAYLFADLEAGDYTVVFTNPTDNVFVTSDAGGDDTVDSDGIDNGDGTATTAPVSIGIGDNIRDVDVGIADPGTASLGDTVFIDENRNGILDDGESTLADVDVMLFDDTGTVIASTTTDENGQYLFDDLNAGTYNILFEEVDGFDFTTANAGGDAGTDSDADAATGRTGDIALDIGVADLTIDAGLIVENAAPVSVDDAGMVCALETTTIDVLANDTDAAGGTVALATVNGVNLTIGESTTLESGAVVTLNNDGTLDYDSTNAVIDGVAAADMLIGDTFNDSFAYTISDGLGETDDGQVAVEVKGVLNTVDTIAETLPTEATTTQGGFRVGLGYSTTIDGTGDSRLDGLFIESAYCIEREEDFVADVAVSMDIAVGSEGSVDDAAFSNNLVDNLDAINWLLNQDFTNQSNGDTSGATAGRNYTEAEIQHAIWGLTDGNSEFKIATFFGSFYNGTQENVDELLALALEQGEGYEAGEGDLLTLILDPTDVQAGVSEDEDYDQAFIVTVSFDDFMQDAVC
ncbi:SdrD B-like domain-containing protein [Roseobacter sp. CCS2]|uniref:SdrD B-like domain-containing protein n=1 Tax=Roseobacter sp. CCS2 TaxID=391593 RepID=UPI0000F3C7DD|nr:SdrD B-like domain-containing protein [Roseobacter sp. CCS2]EBA11901.1 hypothetical protein RCCS2_18271 [Roseobacter sp. CCS2]